MRGNRMEPRRACLPCGHACRPAIGVIAAVTADGKLTLHRASPFLLTSAPTPNAAASTVAWQRSQPRTVCKLGAQHRVTAAAVSADWGCRLHIASASAPGDPAFAAVDDTASVPPHGAAAHLHHVTLKGSPFLPRAAPATAAPTHVASQPLPVGHRVVQLMQSGAGPSILALMQRQNASQQPVWEFSAFEIGKQPLPSENALKCVQVTPVLPLLATAGAKTAGLQSLRRVQLRPCRSSKRAALSVAYGGPAGLQTHALLIVQAPAEGWQGPLQVSSAWPCALVYIVPELIERLDHACAH